MRIKPLNEMILVQRVEGKQKTPGGLYIPDIAAEKPQEGKVIAVGPGKINENGNVVPVGLKEGDYILFGKYCGNEIKFNETDYLLMRESDIFGLIEN